MKNSRILKLAFACLIMAAVISWTPQGGTSPASAALECPSSYTTGGGWTCSFAYVVCDQWECCCWYTPSINDGRQCPSYCY